MLPAALYRRASAFDCRPSLPSVIGCLANHLDIPGFADPGVFLLASEITIGRLETHLLLSGWHFAPRRCGSSGSIFRSADQ